MNKTIYTFWEPKEKMPAYIQFCISTWKKYLSDYKIVILDYSNIDEYLGKNYFNKCLYKKFTLPVQADAIRCAILNKYGGIWMDCDTIVTSEKAIEIINNPAELVLFGRHIGFIVAQKGSKIVKQWLFYIKLKLFIYSYLRFLLKKLDKNYKNRTQNWDYLGNSILNKILDKTAPQNYCSNDRINMKVLPEMNYYSKLYKEITDSDLCEMYKNFYFENDFSDYALENTSGIILLHNSRTPEKYRTMDENLFLSENNTLSNIFKKLLSIE